MGSGHSVRTTHFQNAAAADDADDEMVDKNQISISNKMVERLVEEATLAGGAAVVSGASAAPRGDYKDKIYMEKLMCMDENHSERLGITVEDLKATAARIELRTANMVSPEPVCDESQRRVIRCYAAASAPADVIQCWNTVGDFTKCVHDAATMRLHARTQKEAREHVRRSRHVAHAREHALKDLGSSTTRDDSIPS